MRVCWFPLRWVLWPGPGRSREPGTPSRCGTRQSAAFPAHQQEAGWEAEPRELEPALKRDAGVAGGGWPRCTATLARAGIPDAESPDKIQTDAECCPARQDTAPPAIRTERGASALGSRQWGVGGSEPPSGAGKSRPPRPADRRCPPEVCGWPVGSGRLGRLWAGSLSLQRTSPHPMLDAAQGWAVWETHGWTAT